MDWLDIKDMIKVTGLAAAVMSLIIAPPLYLIERWGQREKGKRAIGLETPNIPKDNIKRVSPRRDYNNDGHWDYVVQFSDGRSEIFYGRGFDRKDISNKVKWNYFWNTAKIEE